ncbi:serine/threonine protein kinase [Stigmatella aurantiaca]|uniref:Protein kinase n=1 Tax=Stigmatella aurantiaca (strain DW4/3-1) TaxID=378806 RepID=Q097M1_STIAD|nr:serine/threonine-protein kinase [Stigmatella aurantiaca]ADO75758.1 Protein kinase [Stigmatella aurantiaca DW4/3-1]EAU67935.1 protein kinase domain [Stigmatella aurantiaca DW4/3-1]
MRVEGTTEPHGLFPGTEVHPDYLPPGTVVSGFRLLRHVDSGGYGSVWLVESVERPGCRYALKFSLHSPGNNPRGDARAARELRLLLQVSHANVVRVVAHGRWKDPETGLHYVVLEWVQGATLLEWVRRTNPSLRELVRLCQKVVLALQAAHEAGVLHRDVKPGNVLVRAADGEPFLADFGAGEAGGTGTLTRGGARPFTPPYCSPRVLASQLEGASPYRFRPTDDWYSVGVMLYVVLTEVLPFPEGLPNAAFARQVARQRPVPLHLINSRIPPALSHVVLRLLSKNPRQRYRNGRRLCAALEHVLKQAGVWDAQVYAPRPVKAPELATTLPPTPGDGVVAKDEEVLAAHELKALEGHEEQRREAARNQRDLLLSVQARNGSAGWTRIMAAGALGVLAVGLWAVWPQAEVVPRALPVAPASPLKVRGPLIPPSPDSFWPLLPTPPAPVAVSPLLFLPFSSPDAPQKDSPVKNPETPLPAQPPFPPPGKVIPKTPRSGKGAVCAVAGFVVSCTGIPVRPEPQACPPEAIEAMEAIRIRARDGMNVRLNPNYPPTNGNDSVSFRVGPIVSWVASDLYKHQLPRGTRLFGHIWGGGGDRFYIRYTEAQLVNGPRFPICAVAEDGFDGEFGLIKAPGSTKDTFKHTNIGIATFVEVFSE